MDSIEEKYTLLKSITGIVLVFAVMFTFSTILSRESWKIEKKYKKMVN